MSTIEPVITLVMSSKYFLERLLPDLWNEDRAICFSPKLSPIKEAPYFSTLSKNEASSSAVQVFERSSSFRGAKSTVGVFSFFIYIVSGSTE